LRARRTRSTIFPEEARPARRSARRMPALQCNRCRAANALHGGPRTQEISAENLYIFLRPPAASRLLNPRSVMVGWFDCSRYADGV